MIIIKIINFVIFFGAFFSSGLIAGTIFDLLRHVLASNIFFILNLILSLILFYLIFLSMGVIYYRLVLMIIGKGECTTNRADKSESFKYELRVIIDVLVIQFASPVILHCPDFLKLLGAKIGNNFAMAGTIYNSELVEIEDNVIIGNQALITCHIVDANRVILKRIKIGNNCTIGVRSVVMPGVEIGDNSVVAAGSIVTVDTKIPPNQIWAGIPAKHKGNIR